MRWCCRGRLGLRILTFLHDYDGLQALAVTLLRIQIGCALVGSLGAFFNGVLLTNLVVALFALVAIESSSQSLGRTYAVLLFFAILLDIAWFILFSCTVWNFSPDEKYSPPFVFSIRLALWMQIIGFSVRLLSSVLWIQMYRLGVSSSNTAYHEAECDARNSFLSVSTQPARLNSISDEILGGSVCNPSYDSSLFEDVRDKGCANEADKHINSLKGGLTSDVDSPNYQACNNGFIQVGTSLRISPNSL